MRLSLQVQSRDEEQEMLNVELQATPRRRHSTFAIHHSTFRL
jgi:hypothetical protein